MIPLVLRLASRSFGGAATATFSLCAVFPFAAALSGCPSEAAPPPRPDAGSDAGTTDAEPPPGDAGRDAGRDAGPCADDPTTTACGGECVDTSSDVRHCGGCDLPCAPPADATATCDGTCDFACDNGFVRDGDTCLEAPRPLFPPSLSGVTSTTPEFRWINPSGVSDATLEVCADRACGTVLASSSVTGETATLPSPLVTGRVFWRVVADGRASVSWLLVVRPTRATQTAWGVYPDYDGDGLGDLVVGAPRVGGDEGRAYLHLGAPGGTAAGASVVLRSPDGDGAEYGLSLTCAGDLDGDGYADAAVGSPGAADDAGRVHIHYGGPSGLPSSPSTTVGPPATSSGRWGGSIAGVGDVDGDGYGDLLVGSLGSGVSPGHAFLLRGGRRGLLTSPVWETVESGAYATAMAGVGDLNGDGFADVAVTAPATASMTGTVRVFFGSSTGLPGTADLTIDGPDGAGGQFGFSVASAGDLDGDGLSDLVVGAPGVASSRGSAHVFLGASGPSTTPDVSVAGQNTGGGFFGHAVAGFGDGNGDGLDDLAIGGFGVGSRTGRLVVFLGDATGLVTATRLSIDGPGGDDGDFGWSLAPVGDVDGNGRPDLAVGAPRVEAAMGRAYIYRAGDEGLNRTPLVTLRGASGGTFGRSTAAGVR